MLKNLFNYFFLFFFFYLKITDKIGAHLKTLVSHLNTCKGSNTIFSCVKKTFFTREFSINKAFIDKTHKHLGKTVFSLSHICLYNSETIKFIITNIFNIYIYTYKKIIIILIIYYFVISYKLNIIFLFYAKYKEILKRENSL